MEIVEISDFKTKKVKISFDNGIALVLYKSDLCKYDLSIGEVDEQKWSDLMETLSKRALNRAVGLISGRDMTEGMLTDKLTGDGYPGDIVIKTVERMKNERLIDDNRYIKGYIESKSEKKSKNDIIRELSMKGIDSDKALAVYDELYNKGYIKDETTLIREILDKKHFFEGEVNYETSSKMIQYLLRKGFSFDSIHSAIKNE